MTLADFNDHNNFKDIRENKRKTPQPIPRAFKKFVTKFKFLVKHFRCIKAKNQEGQLFFTGRNVKIP